MDKQLPKPTLISFVLLSLMYFISVKFCTYFAMTPEGTVLIWLPNAFALTALLYYQGQRYWLFMSLVVGAEIAGDLPIFTWQQSIRLGLTNVAEVTLAYLLLRKLNFSPIFNKLEDVVKFIFAGPLISSILGAFVGAYILHTKNGGLIEYLSLVQTWWFGDALGLIIGTPLLLSILYHFEPQIKPLKSVDYILSVVSISLLLLLLISKDGEFSGLLITPMLLIPSMLYLALRTNIKWTAVAVAIFSFIIAMLISIGSNPFGNLPVSKSILHAQEFIAILSLACFGFAILNARIRNNEIELEKRVTRRTEELETLKQKFEQLSTIDSLTGLANRRRFDDVLNLTWSRAMRTQDSITLLFLDIDWFKAYNDRYGHQQGDECLRKVSYFLSKKFLRAGDLVARYGGEEFVLLASGLNKEQAVNIANDLCMEINSLSIKHESSPYGFVTVSIGICTIKPRFLQSSNVLVKLADDALYEAKESGRNRFMTISID